MFNSKIPYIIFSITALIYSCSTNNHKTEFKDWYSQNYETKSGNCNPVLQVKQFVSKPLKIEGIAKSMAGDMQNQEVEINEVGEDLIWLRGCELTLSNSVNGDKVEKEFLCHSIINYAAPEKLPWEILTIGTDKRIFTLSQGAHKLEFPEGFALPLKVPISLSIGNQVLNLNKPELKLALNYNVSLKYYKNRELCTPPKALYQQAVFVTKKVAGPEGAFYQKDTSFSHIKGDMDTVFAQCGVSYSEGYNPYFDPYGRQYTGHWLVDSTDTIEVLKTNVTPLLNLKYDTKIHYIAVHVHPYAKSLELVDKTTGSSLFKANVTNLNSAIGISHVDSYSSKEGIPVFVDHEYQLISTYRNPNKLNNISAMATMFLYMQERVKAAIN